MSLAHSFSKDPKGYRPSANRPDGKEGWKEVTSRKSEKKARCLSQPSFAHDAMLTGGQTTIHVNGNSKPQEPDFLQRRPSGSGLPPRKAGHIHQKPWSSCIAIGRKENPHHINPYHRVWMFDAGRVGSVYEKDKNGHALEESTDLGQPRRWNRRRKQEYYQTYEAEMNKLKPHDEIYAIHANAKFWTHLQNGGARSGGQEKLQPVPPMDYTKDENRASSANRGKRAGHYHLKHGLYMGKFTNISSDGRTELGVKPAQLILKTGRKRKDNHNEPDEWMVDTRPMFDNRLHDDQVKYEDSKDREMAKLAFELSRPSNTRSCPQMGADYMHR